MSGEACGICGYGRREHVGDGEMIHDFRPAAPVVQGADELRGKLRQELVQWLFERYSSGGLMELRGCQADADALLSGPLAQLLAERDELRAKVARVRELAEDCVASYPQGLLRLTTIGRELFRALDGV